MESHKLDLQEPDSKKLSIKKVSEAAGEQSIQKKKEKYVQSKYQENQKKISKYSEINVTSKIKQENREYAYEGQIKEENQQMPTKERKQYIIENKRKSDSFQKKNLDKKKQSQYQRKQRQRRQKEIFSGHYEKKKGEGLPNVGNTCFLNSLIQFFYASESLRSYLLMNPVKKTFTKLMSDIFKAIRDQQPLSYKAQIMESLMKKLQFLDDDYRLYSQQDAINFMFHILGKLKEENPRIIDFFAVQFSDHCKYCKDIIIPDIYVAGQSKICTKCREQKRLKLYIAPKSLIMINNEKDPKEERQFLTEKGKIKYSLAAKISYSGSGQYGHYISYRQIEGQWYCFNDGYVYPEETYSPSYYGKQGSNFYNSYNYYPTKSYYSKKTLVVLYQYLAGQLPLKRQNQKIIFQPQPQLISMESSKIFKEKQIYKPKNFKGGKFESYFQFNVIYSCTMDVLRKKNQGPQFLKDQIYQFQQRKVFFTIKTNSYRSQSMVFIENKQHFPYISQNGSGYLYENYQYQLKDICHRMQKHLKQRAKYVLQNTHDKKKFYREDTLAKGVEYKPKDQFTVINLDQ